MKLKFSFKNWLRLIGGAVVVAFLILVIFLPDSIVFRPIPIIPFRQANVGLPVRLTIPSINVDAAIEYVGVASDGTMGVPKGPSDVAWFEYGPRPGEIGSAVIAGHYGWKNGIPAVFDDASKLQKGDKIIIEDDKGVTTTFVVRELQLFGEKGNATEVFSSGDGKAHLNLITCEGVWNPATKSYSERLVVFADKE